MYISRKLSWAYIRTGVRELCEEYGLVTMQMALANPPDILLNPQLASPASQTVTVKVSRRWPGNTVGSIMQRQPWVIPAYPRCKIPSWRFAKLDPCRGDGAAALRSKVLRLATVPAPCEARASALAPTRAASCRYHSRSTNAESDFLDSSLR
jgi:hypothetical protein